jgi:DNA end-binding protein Ku
MRSLWKGSVGFGLVNIPVKMYLAAEESNISFVQLDKKTHSRIKYKKVSEQTGKELQTEDIVKAYQLGDDYVIVEEADFQKAAPEKVDHLEIAQFVNEKEIDAVFFEKPYYLEPDRSGAKAYALLRDALLKEHKAALGQLVYQSKEWVCLIKPLNNVLVLHRLRFSDEIRSTSGLDIPETIIKPEELKMASLLIAQLTKPFKAQDYRDTYSEKLLKVIEAKAKGKITGKPLKVVHNATTGDLMEKLKASLKTKTANRKAS